MDAKRHLSNFKTSCLGITENGIWRSNGKRYSHILPEERRFENLLPPFAAEILNYIRSQSVRLHSDFHHLNSSQAYALNLFYPPLACGPATSAKLVHALNAKAVGVLSWEFESVPVAFEGTNVDLLLRLEDSSRILVEVKFTETGFGKGRPDDEHIRKLETIYAPILRDLVKPEYLQQDKFFMNYQLLRNVALCSRDAGDYLVFVIPEKNRSAWRHARDFLENAFLTRPTWITLLDANKLLSDLASVDAGEKYAQHYANFSTKYVF